MATFRRRHPGLLRFPSIERAFRHAVLAAEIGTLRARLMLLKNPEASCNGGEITIHCIVGQLL
jgi:hypothetical protein